jgi:hypothetical protein
MVLAMPTDAIQIFVFPSLPIGQSKAPGVNGEMAGGRKERLGT